MYWIRSLVTIASYLAITVVIVTTGMASSAYAQSPYVGASALADIARFGTAGVGSSSGGEAFGVAVRVGTAITDRWGIDLEFTRPGAIEESNRFDFPVPLLPALGAVAGTAPTRPAGAGNTTGIGGLIGSIFPVPAQLTTTHRFTTLSVMPWVRQSLGSRADIVYLGGLGFLRTASQVDYGGVIILGGGRLQEYVTYDVAPVVGLDVRVSMTDHLRLVPGVRLMATGDAAPRGWITRPSVGLQWAF
jgi:hypothetical protein